MKRLSAPYGTCVKEKSSFNPTVSRTVRECIQAATLKLYLTECGCVPWYLYDEIEELVINGVVNQTYIYEKWFSDYDCKYYLFFYIK